ncbi:MAG: hypothetical protein R6W48_13080 [Gaiellaceae bacterium]
MTTPTMATSTETAPTTPPEPAAEPVTVVRITVRDGKVAGGIRRVTVQRGDEVRLVVASDVADEVHLHGYDRTADVAPGAPARIAFVASIPGRFEVELEERGIQIADVQVRP